MSVAPHVSDGPAQRIQELLSHTGDDLPILRQSCQGIIDCTEDDTSSAYDVSEVITHDQALEVSLERDKASFAAVGNAKNRVVSRHTRQIRSADRSYPVI